MNINYEDIITKANARKDALKALEAGLKDVDGHATQLLESLGYFKSLQLLAKAIDDEGTSMVLPILPRVNSVGNICASAYAQLTTKEATYGSDIRDVMALVEAVEL